MINKLPILPLLLTNIMQNKKPFNKNIYLVYCYFVSELVVEEISDVIVGELSVIEVWLVGGFAEGDEDFGEEFVALGADGGLGADDGDHFGEEEGVFFEGGVGVEGVGWDFEDVFEDGTGWLVWI